MRTLSRQFFSQQLHFARRHCQTDLKSSLLVLIQDGMDQAKLRVPRFGYYRISKAMEKVYRPALHLVGTWIHGWKLGLCVTNEDVKKNSETMIELITLALSSLVDQTNSLPLSFHLQQDNCAREGKNRFVMNFMLLLTILQCFRATSMAFLRSAHSHEDIDQCFGQISRLLMGKRCGSAAEMVALIAEATMDSSSGHDGKSRLRASVVESFKVDEVSAWKNFVSQTGLRFKGLRRVHYFRFCMRQDLGADVLDNVAELEEFHHFSAPSRGHLLSHQALAGWYRNFESDCAGASLQSTRDSWRVSSTCWTFPQTLNHWKSEKQFAEKSSSSATERWTIRWVCKLPLQWSSGTLGKIPKPHAYSIFSYSYKGPPQVHQPGAWRIPHRVAHHDLTLETFDEGAQSDDSSSDDAAVDLGGLAV